MSQVVPWHHITWGKMAQSWLGCTYVCTHPGELARFSTIVILADVQVWFVRRLWRRWDGVGEQRAGRGGGAWTRIKCHIQTKNNWNIEVWKFYISWPIIVRTSHSDNLLERLTWISIDMQSLVQLENRTCVKVFLHRGICSKRPC